MDTARHVKSRTRSTGSACWDSRRLEGEVLELLADHLPDQARAVVLADRPAAGELPVAEDRDVVDEVEDLVKPVGDEGDRDAVSRSAADHLEERRDLGRRVSELVGSSRITTRASIESARAISTICCCSGRSEPAGTDGSMSSCRRPSISTAVERVRRQSIPHQRFGLRGPSRMFSATESSGTRVVSWVTVAIPAARASAASPKAIGSPSR